MCPIFVIVGKTVIDIYNCITSNELVLIIIYHYIMCLLLNTQANIYILH